MLDGLPAEYDVVVTTILSRPDQPTIEEVHNLLVSFDLRLEKRHVTERLLPQLQHTSINDNSVHPKSHPSNNATFSHQPSPYNLPFILLPSPSVPQSSLLGTPPTYPTPRHNRWNSRPPPPKCQICFKPGHTAAKCYHRLNSSYRPPSYSQAYSQPQKYLHSAYRPPASSPTFSHPVTHFTPTFPAAPLHPHPTISSSAPITYPPHAYQSPIYSPQTYPTDTWLLDTGATHHTTPDVSTLQDITPYQGTLSVLLGNGTKVPIAHTGTKILHNLHLSHTLHTPAISQKLISVSRLCSDNNVLVEFHSNYFFIKDKTTHQILFSGPAHQGLYQLQLPPPNTSNIPPTRHPLHLSPKALPAQLQQLTTDQWHARLGHPSLEVLRKALKDCKPSMPYNKLPFC